MLVVQDMDVSATDRDKEVLGLLARNVTTSLHIAVLMYVPDRVIGLDFRLGNRLVKTHRFSLLDKHSFSLDGVGDQVRRDAEKFDAGNTQHYILFELLLADDLIVVHALGRQAECANVLLRLNNVFLSLGTFFLSEVQAILALLFLQLVPLLRLALHWPIRNALLNFFLPISFEANASHLLFTIIPSFSLVASAFVFYLISALITLLAKIDDASITAAAKLEQAFVALRWLTFNLDFYARRRPIVPVAAVLPTEISLTLRIMLEAVPLVPVRSAGRLPLETLLWLLLLLVRFSPVNLVRQGLLRFFDDLFNNLLKFLFFFYVRFDQLLKVLF
jgi:hypothetical protein